jgi:signal transduction histidine kinase
VRLRLPTRLFISHMAVATGATAVAYVTIRLLVPHLFDQRMGRMDGSGLGSGPRRGSGTRLREVLLPALDSALAVGLLAGAAVAAVMTLLVTRRLLRPLDDVRTATRRIAAGRYEGGVPLPADPELAALASDVNTLAASLADTESRRTRLLGDVAHEMRTPLTALDGYVEGLIDGVFTPDPATLDALSEELRRLHRLADDLSGLSRAQERRLDLHPDDVDLAALVRRAADRLEPQFDDAGVTLAVQAATALPGHVDADRIMQVLTNLLGNALLATPEGGAVTIAARGIAGQAVITVADTGVGLSASDAERVFERFYRVAGHPRRSAGSGVGLTIARGIAHGHGGDITAASPGPGRGATFTLTLPARPTGDTPSS